MPEKPLLRLEGIYKEFPGVKALSDVQFTLRKGEIHALMGENGAGKSTLIKVLTGVCKKDKGTVLLNGKTVNIRSSQEAQKAGIGTVYQEISLFPNLTVAENLFTGRINNFFVRWKKIYSEAERILKSLNIPARPDQQLSTCSIAVQQMIAIARAIDMNCQVLILDEPTSSLDEQETDALFALMSKLKKNGTGIIFVTHFLDQVYKICDHITILRDGKFIGEYETTSLSRLELISKMVGEDLKEDEIIERGKRITTDQSNSSVFLEVSELRRSETVKDFNFTVKKGQVNGLTGLLGSGRSEAVRALFGADRPDKGTINIKGKKVNIKKPRDAMKNGIGYLPEDRKKDGIIGDLSVKDNILLALQSMRGFFRPVSVSEGYRIAEEYIRILDIKTASADTPVRALSGGNQQKVILARWLITNSEYLILDEPTRGIDVAAKMEIQNLVLKLAEEGKSITFISSEINEMLRVCSELTVLRDNRIVGTLSGEELTQNKILATIAGGE